MHLANLRLGARDPALDELEEDQRLRLVGFKIGGMDGDANEDQPWILWRTVPCSSSSEKSHLPNPVDQLANLLAIFGECCGAGDRHPF